MKYKTELEAEIESGELSRAIYMAAAFHYGQLDKGGNPYILHPLRVMLRCDTNKERTVAVLHDVLEDTNLTVDSLKANFDEEIVAAVVALTRGSDERYADYIARVIENPLASRVKLADLEDNMDVRRIPTNFEGQMPGFQRYAEAHLKIRKALA